jgi:hypothetical protein
MLIFATIGISAFGFWRLGLGNAERRELARERAWSRIYLAPLLLAEADRDAFRRDRAALLREKLLMKDVPDWEVCCCPCRHDIFLGAKTNAVLIASLLSVYLLIFSVPGWQECIQYEALHTKQLCCYVGNSHSPSPYIEEEKKSRGMFLSFLSGMERSASVVN